MGVAYVESFRGVAIWSDPSYVTFVAKIQKAKTRKNRDYFVSRVTVPKDLTKKMDAKPGEYLFFKVKKAQWYHMLDWETMKNTWKMLPDEIRNRVILDGLYYHEAPNQIMKFRKIESLGATNLSAPIQQMADMQTDQTGDVYGSSV